MNSRPASEFRYAEQPLVGRVNDGTEGIYVGRMGIDPIFGNPYHIGPRGKGLTREQTIEHFRLYLAQKIRTHPDKWLPLLASLKGERLICHCAPQPCHADVLVKASEWAFAEIGGVE